jgi:hypothetical protein
VRIFISVVSHRDHDVIINLGAIRAFADIANIEVVCRDNWPVGKLKTYCDRYGIHYVANKKQQGFAANNNENYLYCKFELGMQEDDYFILLNPDIFMTEENIQRLIAYLEAKAFSLGVANLFLDREEVVHDDNIRLYPKFTQFLKTYLLNDRSTMINRRKGLPLSDNYWASCSFLVVKADVYNQLNGLDERYYMYCEDIDFSYRAQKAGVKLHYLENAKAVHFRRRESKRFLSKYFFWHVRSVFKYSFTKKKELSLISKLEYQNLYKND